MKTILGISLAVLLSVGGFNLMRPNEINDKIEEAEGAFKRGNYKVASKRLLFLRDSMDLTDPEISLNAGHAFYLAEDSAARDEYTGAAVSSGGHVKSVANQQLGALELAQAGDINKLISYCETALEFFKESLRAESVNEDSRYNYELTYRVLELLKQQKEEQEQNQDQQNQDQKDQQNQDKKDQEQNQDEQKNQDQNQENQDKKDQQKEGQDKKESDKKDGEQKDEQKNEGEQKGEDKEGEQKEGKSAEAGKKDGKNEQILRMLQEMDEKYMQRKKKVNKRSKKKNLPDW